MAVRDTKNLEQRLSEMSGAEEPAPSLGIEPMQEQEQAELPSVQVAQAAVSGSARRQATKKILSDVFGQSPAETLSPSEFARRQKKAEKEKAAEEQAKREAEEKAQEAATLPETPVTPASKSVQESFAEDDLEAIVNAGTQDEINARQAPSPTPSQKEAGVEAAPFKPNTTFYDEDGLAALVKEFGDRAVDPKNPRTIDDIIADAREAGVKERIINQQFQGKDMTTKIGGDEISKTFAGMVDMLNAGWAELRELQEVVRVGSATAEQAARFVEVAERQRIMVSYFQDGATDIARTMNVFKKMGDLTNVESMSVLDDIVSTNGGMNHLRDLANKLHNAESNRERSKMLRPGILGAFFDAGIQTAQSMYISSPDTWLFSAASMVNMLAETLSTPAAIAIGKTRQSLFGQRADPDRYYAEDVVLRASGYVTGLRAAILRAAKFAVEGGATRDFSANKMDPRNFHRAPLNVGGFLNIPTKTVSVRGRDIQFFPTMKEEDGQILEPNAFGRIIQGVGLLQELLSFRPMGMVDEFSKGFAHTVVYQEQAMRHAAKVYDDAIEAGLSPEDAIKAQQQALVEFADETPIETLGDMLDYGKQVSLQGDIDRSTAIGKVHYATQRVAQSKLFKPLTLFAKSAHNGVIEGLAGTPFAQLSPAFWTNWKKGGRHRDMALAKQAMGTAAFAAVFYDDSFTGPGPADYKRREIMEKSGWRPNSFRTESAEITDEIKYQVAQIMGPGAITLGTGEFEGEAFINLERMEYMTAPFLMAAAAREAFTEFDYRSEEGMAEKIAFVGSHLMVNQLSQRPEAEAFARVLDALASPPREDGDSKVSRFIRVLGGEYAKTATAAVPGLGYPRSSLWAHISRTRYQKSEAERGREAGVPSKRMTLDQFNATVEAGGDPNSELTRFYYEMINDYKRRAAPHSLAETVDFFGDTKPYSETMMSPFGFRMGPRVSTRDPNLLAVRYEALGAVAPSNTTNYRGVQIPAEATYFLNYYRSKVLKINGMSMSEAIIKATDGMAKKQGPDIRFRGDLVKELKRVEKMYTNRALNDVFGKVTRRDDFSPYYFQKPGHPDFTAVTQKMLESLNASRDPQYVQP